MYRFSPENNILIPFSILTFSFPIPGSYPWKFLLKVFAVFVVSIHLLHFFLVFFFFGLLSFLFKIRRVRWILRQQVRGKRWRTTTTGIRVQCFMLFTRFLPVMVLMFELNMLRFDYLSFHFHVDDFILFNTL